MRSSLVTPWKKTKNPLEFVKEVLPVGRIVKWVSNDQEVQEVKVTKNFLERKVEQFQKMREVGVRIPVYNSHIENPDNERGLVKDAFIARNKKGLLALFNRIKFHTLAAARKATRVDVSIGLPPKFVDGRGNVYDYPQRHLALTSIPVVPGLGEWEPAPIVLSFDTPSGLMLSNESESIMKNATWNALLQALGVSRKGSFDEQMTNALAKAKKLAKGVRLSGDEDEDEDDEDDEDEDEDEDELSEEEEAGKEEAVALSHSPVLLREMRLAREARINALAGGDNPLISPAKARKLKLRFCTPEAINSDLNMSEGDGETEFDRALDLIKEVAEDRPLAKSGRGIIRLSHSEDDGAETVLVRQAKKLAAKAK